MYPFMPAEHLATWIPATWKVERRWPKFFHKCTTRTPRKFLFLLKATEVRGGSPLLTDTADSSWPPLQFARRPTTPSMDSSSSTQNTQLPQPQTPHFSFCSQTARQNGIKDSSKPDGVFERELEDVARDDRIGVRRKPGFQNTEA